MEYSIVAKVTDVTVYPDRARVLCSGTCELDEGHHTLIVGELPLGLEPESVRAQGAGTAQVRLRSVDVNRHNYAEAPSARVRGLEDALQERHDALQTVTDTRSVAEAGLAHLDGMRRETEQYARGLARGQSTVEDQARLLSFIQEQDRDLRRQMRELEGQARDIQREIDKLTAELNQLRSARPRQRYEVLLDVEVLKAGEFSPEISYVVGQAGWQPLYEMRFLQPEDNKTTEAVLKVTYLAQISQNTGQPWDHVRLTVSTARPALNQRMPELRPWFVDEYQPPELRPQPRNAMLKSVAAPMAMADAMPAEPMPERYAAEVAVANVQGEPAAVTFAISGEVDIPSDGTPHKTVIGQFDLMPEVDYFCVPRHTDAVFRRATVTNTAPGPFLAGRVNLFTGDEFIGSNALDYTPVNGELELLLGVEERIEVERELARRDVDKRLLRDIRQIAFGYEISLRNGLKTAAAVVVQDQYPATRHEQIKIKLESATPTPTSQTELHIIEWEIVVPPESTKKLQYSYTVEHPRDMKVSGLAD